MGCSPPVTLVFLLDGLVYNPEVNVAGECISLNVLGSRFLFLSELIQSPVHHEALGYSKTTKSYIYNWSISEFLMFMSSSLSSLLSCGV